MTFSGFGIARWTLATSIFFCAAEGAAMALRRPENQTFPTTSHSASVLRDATNFEKRTFTDNHILMTKIKIGLYNPQEVEVLLDTGSSDMVIPLITCNECSRAAFDRTKSPTLHDTGLSYYTRYGNGESVSGTEVMDVVTVGTVSVVQDFAAITSAKGAFPAYGSGILGLGFPQLSDETMNPFIFHLLKQGISTFSVHYPSEKPAEICWGCIDDRFAKDIIYHPVLHALDEQRVTQWKLKSGGIGLGKGVISKASTAIIDTGTYGIYVSREAATALYAKIPGSKRRSEDHWTIPCNTKPVTIWIQLGSKNYSLPWEDFVVAKGTGIEGEAQCIGAVLSGASYEGRILVGSAFLKNYYTVFDFGENRIGFAPLDGGEGCRAMVKGTHRGGCIIA